MVTVYESDSSTAAAVPALPPVRKHLPPVIILGGGTNALSIARSLGRGGVRVYAINKPDAMIRYSRFAEWIPLPSTRDSPAAWYDFLLTPAGRKLEGAILLAASDEALQFIALNRHDLQKRYLLDDSNPEAQLCLLSKSNTYRAAREAGVPTPRFWILDSGEDIAHLRDELVYPLIVKPDLSHVFVQRFGAKFFVAESFEELQSAVETARGAETGLMLVEKIPGPDSRLCSYYTYLDEEGSHLFSFTKRIIRRYPLNMGLATYHITDHVPGLRELAEPLFRHVGLRGLANVEFKWDERDSTYRLIECNARFTAANGLVARSGFDLARFVYNRLAGLPQPPLEDFRDGLRLWYPVNDFRAFCELHRRGEITCWQWLRSILHRQQLPAFTWNDPLPAFVHEWRRAKRRRTDGPDRSHRVPPARPV